jgi:hypothetical protein
MSAQSRAVGATHVSPTFQGGEICPIQDESESHRDGAKFTLSARIPDVPCPTPLGTRVRRNLLSSIRSTPGALSFAFFCEGWDRTSLNRNPASCNNSTQWPRKAAPQAQRTLAPPFKVGKPVPYKMNRSPIGTAHQSLLFTQMPDTPGPRSKYCDCMIP